MGHFNKYIKCKYNVMADTKMCYHIKYILTRNRKQYLIEI